VWQRSISLVTGWLPHVLGVYRRGDGRCPGLLTFLALAYRLARRVVAG